MNIKYFPYFTLICHYVLCKAASSLFVVKIILFSDAKFRAHIMSSDDCLVTSIYDESCVKVYLYCICVSPIDIFALAIPRSLGVAEAPVCRGIKAT